MYQQSLTGTVSINDLGEKSQIPELRKSAKIWMTRPVLLTVQGSWLNKLCFFGIDAWPFK